ncbi:MAG: hypothetical protein COA50_07995, partial [Flavobacteriaceae bacterium]
MIHMGLQSLCNFLTKNIAFTPLKIILLSGALFLFGFGGYGQVSIADISFNEANTTVTFDIIYTGPVVASFSVDYTTSDGSATAGTDYTTTSSMLLFSGNPETQTFNVTIANDGVPEMDEIYNVTLSNIFPAVTTFTNTTATGTIVNDDGLSVEFSTGASSDTETAGGNLPTLLVTGTVILASTVTVTDAGTGNATGGGTDFSFTSPQLVNIPAAIYDGTTATEITIPILAIVGDAIVEVNETIDLTLSTPTGDAALGATTASTYTINDDDTATVSIDDPVSVAEGDVGTATLTFTVSIDQ